MIVSTNWISECYRAVPTEELIHMLEDFSERAEYSHDHEDRELWKEKKEGVRTELIRRQELLDEIEI